MKAIIIESLKKSLTYLQFRELVSNSLNDDSQVVNGIDLAVYTKLNDHRMKRLDKTAVITNANQSFLESFTKPVLWMVLTEGWCGDAAQSLPIINKMAELSNAIELKIVLRDENEDLMNLFLTNGAKSIPKLIVVDAKSFEIIGDWGPRPSGAVQLLNELKEKFGSITDEVKEELQKWYNTDKGISAQNEIIQILKNSVK